MQINIKEVKDNLAKVTNNVTPPRQSISYGLCVKADALRFAKSYQESIKVYLQAIMLDRNETSAYMGLAFSYKYLNQYKKAIDIINKLVKIDSSEDLYFYELGVCYLMDGQPENAVEALIKAIVINNENLEAQIQLAIAHELLGETELSISIYDRIIELHPEFLKAYYNKGAMLMGLGCFGEAAKTFFNIHLNKK